MDPVLSGSLCFLVLAVVMYVKFIREHPWVDDDGSSSSNRKSSPVEPDTVPFLHPQSPVGVALKLKQNQSHQPKAAPHKVYKPSGGGGSGGSAMLLPAGQHYPGFLNKQPMRRRTHSATVGASAGGGSGAQGSAADGVGGNGGPGGAGDGGGSVTMDQQQLPSTIFEDHDDDHHRRQRHQQQQQHPHHHHHHHPHLHQRYPPSSGRGQHRINFDNIDFDSDNEMDFLPSSRRGSSSAAADDSLDSVPFEDHDDSGFFDLESSVNPPPHLGMDELDGDDGFPLRSPTGRISLGANDSDLLQYRGSDLGMEGTTPSKVDAKNAIERQFVRAVAQPAQMQLEVARKARIPLFLHSPMYVKTSMPPIVDDVHVASPPRLDHFGGAELPDGNANDDKELVKDFAGAVADGGGAAGGRLQGGMTPRRRDKLPASANANTTSLHIDFSELKVAELIGQGAFGTVHRANWRGTTVAVKILVCQHLTVDILEEFETEVHIMSILRYVARAQAVEVLVAWSMLAN